MWAFFMLGTVLLASPPEGAEEEEHRFLAREGAAWLRGLRDRHRPDGRPLTGPERHALEGYFPPRVLDRARLTRVPGIDNPEFFARFTDRGDPPPIDFRQMTALAAHDTILIVDSRAREDDPSWIPLLFHELVHVVQHRVLGREGYVETYVRGWAGHGRRYKSIPMEVQAYALAARFRAEPGKTFSVEAEVRRLFARP